VDTLHFSDPAML